MAAKMKKQDELEQHIAELTVDLQRTRADFENYRRRTEQEKIAARQSGQESAIAKLLPVVDNIERAISHTPADLTEHAWVQGVSKLTKNLEGALQALNVHRIDAAKGTLFDPSLHEAIQFDEEAEGEHEVVAEELQAGYLLNGNPIRPAMVKVTRQTLKK